MKIPAAVNTSHPTLLQVRNLILLSVLSIFPSDSLHINSVITFQPFSELVLRFIQMLPFNVTMWSPRDSWLELLEYADVDCWSVKVSAGKSFKTMTTPPPCHIYSSSEYYILQIKDIQALCVRDGTHHAQSCTRQSFSQKTISHCCFRIRWLIPKLAQSKDQGRLNVCDETTTVIRSTVPARMFIFWWYCAREWFYQGGRYKTLALNLDNLWIAIVKLGADMRQAGNQKNIFYTQGGRSCTKPTPFWSRN